MEYPHRKKTYIKINNEQFEKLKKVFSKSTYNRNIDLEWVQLTGNLVLVAKNETGFWLTDWADCYIQGIVDTLTNKE